ncbi:MAG: hypothetical protein EXQ58_09725 [Acidobacteria bacterium]|nr:hypothetical protein [Acidobacteriota bacterium]
MCPPFIRSLFILLALVAVCLRAAAQVPGEPAPTISSQLSSVAAASGQAQLVPVPRLEGVEFVNGSGSQIVLERDGKRYLIDTQSQTIRELVPTVIASAQTPTTPPQTATTPAPAAKPEAKKEPDTYYTEDIVLWNLPTAHHLGKKGLIIDFTHRFNSEAFQPGGISDLLGLDTFSFSSLGFTYGITDRWFAGIYRTPTYFGRILQLSTGLQLSRENAGHPLSSSIRVGVEGTNHFRNKYITSLELALARSIKNRAQIYFTPTVSFNNLPLTVVVNDVFNPTPVNGKTTTALGAGLSVDIRPTVAIMGEAIYRVDGRLGVIRPSFMLGIQKKVFRHSFTLGLSNSPGTTLSTRSATRGAYGLDDTFGGLTIGFNLSRRLF